MITDVSWQLSRSPRLERSSHCKTKKKEKLNTTKREGRDQTEKNIGVEKPEQEKRYQEIIEKFKKNADKKQQRKQNVKMQKHKQKMSSGSKM